MSIITSILSSTGVEQETDANILCLIIINKILGLGDECKSDEFLDFIMDTDLHLCIERLQNHGDKYVSSFVGKIIDKYFDDDN